MEKINSTDNATITFPCKIILDHDELPKSSKQWTRAKKYKLVIDKEGLSYGGFFTPFEDIEKATMHIYQSAFFFEYSILSIKSGKSTHYFGIKYSDYWKGDLPFELEKIHEKSPYLLFRKSLIILILIYIFWEVVKK